MKRYLLVLSTLTAFACGDDDSDTTPTTAAEDETTTETETETVAIEKASDIIGATDAAFGSVSTDNFSLTATTCSNGEPQGVSNSDSGYPALLMECKMTSNSNSPDTIRGSVSILKGMFCALENAVSDIEYTTDGTNLLGEEDSLTLTLTDCFSQSVIDEMGSTTISASAATAKLLDSSTGYQKRLTLTVEEDSYVVDFFATADRVGFKTAETGTSPATGSSTQVTIDFTNGIVLYNTIDDRNGGGGADSVYRRNVRMKVTGELSSTDYTFTSVTAIQGIVGQSGSSSDYSGLDDSYSIITLKGTTADGFRGLYFNVNSSSATETSNSCTPSSASCTGNDGLTFSTSDAAYYTGYADWSDFISSGKPLCDGGDLTFASTPSVGDLGSCD